MGLSSQNKYQLWNSSSLEMACVVGHPRHLFYEVAPPRWGRWGKPWRVPKGKCLSPVILMGLAGSYDFREVKCSLQPKVTMFKSQLGDKTNKDHKISKYKCFLFFLDLLNTKWSNYSWKYNLKSVTTAFEIFESFIYDINKMIISYGEILALYTDCEKHL